MSLRFPVPCRLFLFDLDGTLINSMQDITDSVNRALRRMGLPLVPISRISTFVGEGVRTLIQHSLQESRGYHPESEQLETGIRVYMEEYSEHLLDSTTLYPGVLAAMDRMDWASFGVVTNKPEAFARRILDGLGLLEKFCAVLGGDSLAARKPDPSPLRLAMEQCGAERDYSAMVGDSLVDIEAGHAAGMVTCGIAGGFRGRKELESAGCDLIVESFSEIPDYFCAP